MSKWVNNNSFLQMAQHQEHESTGKNISMQTTGPTWFLYWKISTQLWKTRLQNLQEQGIKRIIVPLYWSHHFIDGNLDFGEKNPQTDLHLLSSLAEQLNLALTYLFPFTPNPIFPNGGLPSHLAKTVSVLPTGLPLRVRFLDQVHQIYSFYDPQVLSALKKFAWYIRHYFEQMHITHPILGIHAGHMEEMEFISYRQDYSLAYEMSFAKFYQNQDNEHNIPANAFEIMIEQLFTQTLSNALGNHYQGCLQMAFIHGHPLELLCDFNAKSVMDLNTFSLDTISRCLSLGYIPFSGCDFLEQKISTGSYRMLLELESIPNPAGNFGPHLEEIKTDEIFAAMCFVGNIEYWEQLGLDSFLIKNMLMNTNVHIPSMDAFTFSEETSSTKLFFFRASQINDSHLKKILHGFLLGHTIIIDMHDIDISIENRFHIFIAENGLNLFKFRLLFPMGMVELGEGKLIFIYPDSEIRDSKATISLSIGKKMHFWDKLFALSDFTYAHLQCDSQLFYIWKQMQVHSHNNIYSQMRALCLYNYDSKIKFLRLYKKDECKILRYEPYPASCCTITSFSHFDEIGIQGSGFLRIEFGVL